ncbi:hypothetical protein [Flexithrix dorotheae]|uniref:hypothetical protein n=1 Tax=Flexithrix dorotheae TaxID=70993 RepID=UPI00037F5196|nr:hypothetical protein [Flexithrix dorotheae]
MKKYLLSQLWLTLILIIPSYCFATYIFPIENKIGAFAQFPFFYLLTAFLHYRLIKAKEKNPRQFVTSFMGTMGLKMFISLLAAVGFGLLFRDEVAFMLIHILVLYFVYSTFEIVLILKELKNKKSPIS